MAGAPETTISFNADVFSSQLNALLSWSSMWNSEQMAKVMGTLSKKCNYHQLVAFNDSISTLLQRDYILQLPDELTLQIFSWLDYDSLLTVGAVCHLWYFISNDNSLWRKLWIQRKWDTHKHHPCDKVRWKSLYLIRLAVERNWLMGEYRVTSLIGHDDAVSCIQFDSKHLITGSDDGTLRVWTDPGPNARCINMCNVSLTDDNNFGEPNLGVQTSQAGITCLFLGRNIIVVGLSNGLVKVYCRENYFLIHSILAHASAVLCIKLMGRCLVTGSQDNTVKVFHTDTGTLARVLRGHNDSVLCLDFDHSKLITGSDDTSIRIWSLGATSSECLHILKGHNGGVSCLSCHGNVLVSGSIDGDIKVWDLSIWVCRSTLKGHTAAVHCLQFDECKIVSGAGNDIIKVWDLLTGTCVHTFDEHRSYVKTLQYNDYIILSGGGSGIKVFDFSPLSKKKDSRLCDTNLRTKRNGSWSKSISPGMVLEIRAKHNRDNKL